MLSITKRVFLSNKISRIILNEFCPLYCRYQSYATHKRFYRGTGIIQNENKWEITLDQRRLKTPNGNILSVTNESLARAIASEWDAQSEIIAQPTMHLTAICNTALDNPGKLNRHDIVTYIMEYLATDTLLFQSDEETDLQAVQEEKWGPILQWFQDTFKVTQTVSKSLEPPPVLTETRAVLARNLLSYDFASLNAIVFGVDALKSPILMLACIHRRLEPKDAVMLARLEEEYQLARWGRVPWAHELNQAELTSRVAASVLFIHCALEDHSSRAKQTNREHVAQL